MGRLFVPFFLARRTGCFGSVLHGAGECFVDRSLLFCAIPSSNVHYYSINVGLHTVCRLIFIFLNDADVDVLQFANLLAVKAPLSTLRASLDLTIFVASFILFSEERSFSQSPRFSRS